jgi:putative membrane protein
VAGDRSVGGLDPDVRFLLANERTLLAWIRTGVTLQIAGVGILQFVTRLEATAVLGIALLVLGAAAGAAGYRRYRSADEAIRAGVLPRPGHGPQLLTLAVVALSAVLAAAYLVAQVRQ